MKGLSDWVVVAALVAIGWSALAFVTRGLIGYWFWKHLDFFVLIWVVLPVVAFKLREKHVRSHFSIFVLRVTRNALLTSAIVISVGCFFHYDGIRDAIGHRYIDGYYTTTYDDVTDSGQQTTGTEPHTAHWYSRIGLWLFEWGFLATCFLIPVLTWGGSNKALSEAVLDQDEGPQPNE